MNMVPPGDPPRPVAVQPAIAPGGTGPLHTVGNVLWLVLAGIWMAIAYVIAGVVQCLTIIGFPFGVASFKLAGLALAPFGKQVVTAGAVLPPGSQVYLSV